MSGPLGLRQNFVPSNGNRTLYYEDEGGTTMTIIGLIFVFVGLILIMNNNNR